MNGKQLKNSILQWAIQGKLVPQDSNDEPASVLLEKIRQEKERLIKEKKIKRDKNASIIYRGEDNSYYEKILATGEVKCIDEEIPFEIPQGWEWCRLHDIIIFIGGYAYDSHSFLEKSEYQVLRLGNIKNDAINKSVNPVFIDEILAQNTVRFRCLKNDILVTMTGTRKKRDYFYTVLIDTDHSNMYFNQRVGCLRAIYSPIALWLNKVLKAESILHQVFQYETGTANQGNLGATNIMNTLIPLPPVIEQFRIVRRLEEVHTYVFQYDKAQHELDILNSDIKNTIKKSIVQEAIQGKLVPQIAEEGTAKELLEQIKAEKQKLVMEGKLKKSALASSVIFRGDDNKYYEQIGKKCLDITDEIPFEIPESWTWSRLSSMCSIVNGFTPLRSETKFWDNGTINWFTVEDIKNQGELIHSTKQKITKEATSKERIVRAGSVLLCCTASIGQCALAMVELTTNQQFNALTVTEYNKPMLADNYLFWYAKTLKPTLKRLSGKTTFEFVSVKKVGSILIPIPPFKEQQRIVAQIEKLFEQLR